MDLQDQLKKLFPDHHPNSSSPEEEDNSPALWMQDSPIICKYEKRKGKPVTLLEGYTGATEDFKKLTAMLKSKLQVGGSFKNDVILIQGNNRDRIMQLLKEMGFKTKRVGG